jgi:hypothetical protein
MPLPPPGPRPRLPESSLKAAQQSLRELFSDLDLPTDLEIADSAEEDSTGGLKESKALAKTIEHVNPWAAKRGETKAAWQQVRIVVNLKCGWSNRC